MRMTKAAFRHDRIGTNGHPSAKPSRMTYMAHAKGWVMCRHPGCIPFAVTERRWLEFPLWENPDNYRNDPRSAKQIIEEDNWP